MFTALENWVQNGLAPDRIDVTLPRCRCATIRRRSRIAAQVLDSCDQLHAQLATIVACKGRESLVLSLLAVSCRCRGKKRLTRNREWSNAGQE
jgi:hypothetical protein